MCFSACSFSCWRDCLSISDCCCNSRSCSRAVEVVELLREVRGFSSIIICDPDRYKNSIEGSTASRGDSLVFLRSAPCLSNESCMSLTFGVLLSRVWVCIPPSSYEILASNDFSRSLYLWFSYLRDSSSDSLIKFRWCGEPLRSGLSPVD